MRVHTRSCLLTTGFALALPALLTAQQPSDGGTPPSDDPTRPISATQDGAAVMVRGTVIHQLTLEDLSAVRLTIADTSDPERVLWEGSTDAYGGFVARRLPAGSYVLRAEALSFANVSHTLELEGPGRVDVRVEMVPEAIELEAIVVTVFSQSRMEESGFYERRRSGWGYSLTREEIEDRNPARVSDLFVGIAGARVRRNPPEPAQVRLRGNCVPTVVLDGTAFAFPIRVDALLQPSELEAVEVYHGSTGPVQYLDDSCGLVMLWSRETATLEGNPWSWKRFFVAVGLLGLTVFGWR